MHALLLGPVPADAAVVAAFLGGLPMGSSALGELIALLILSGLIWAAGIVWIKLSERLELRQAARRRARYLAVRGASPSAGT